MKVEINNEGDVGLRIKISELERTLLEEKNRYNQLESQSELAKLVANQEVEKYRRHCLSLRETVSRLEEDLYTLRERHLKDQETVQDLLEEIDAKEREYIEKTVELKVAGVVERNQELVEKVLMLYEENSRLIGEENASKTTKGKENGELEARILKLVEEKFQLVEKEKGVEREIDEEMPNRSVTLIQKEDLLLTPGSGRKRVRIVDDSDSGGNEDGKITSSQLGKRLAEAAHPQVPPRSANSAEKVGDRRVRNYCKRKLNNLTNPRGYTGRIPSDEQLQCAKKRAETLQSNLRFCNPSFIKSMALSHVSSCFWLGLPREFCQKNLPSHEQKMILEDENGWVHEVNYLGGSTGFSGGWRGFALDHNLERGDALIFELCKPTRFKVYIIKAIPKEPNKYFDDRIGGEHTYDADNRAIADTTENQNIDLSDFSKKPLKSWTFKAE